MDDLTPAQQQRVEALTADDVEQIIDGIEHFIIEGDPDVDEVWSPYIKKLRALVSRLVQAQDAEGWRDIATAPKDNNPVLIGWYDDEGKWQERRAWFSREFEIVGLADDGEAIDAITKRY